MNNEKYIVCWSMKQKQSLLYFKDWQSFSSLDKAEEKYRELTSKKRLYTATISIQKKSTEE
tara:strand:+ start:301 stop:483 length:183 start_codon:yes stop_codon:yes gene_type:complete